MDATTEPVPPATRSTRQPRPPSRARIGAYIASTLGLASLAGIGIAAGGDPETNPAALLFILSPVLMAAILRWTGDGWADAGLRLRLRGNGTWYALALLLFPLLTAVVLGIGTLTGAVTWDTGSARDLAAAFVAGLVLRMVYAACEELGWRGYLEPRLAALGMPAARRHLAVAVIWGAWHVPYILTFDLMTDLPLGAYLPLFLISIVPMSFIYGVMRERSGTVWTSVLMHGMANAIAFPLLTTGVVEVDHEVVFAARPEGLIMLAGLCVVAWAVWRSRRVTARRP
ncbi:CPBP family intramembrane glutamic endopeptidase [Demequina sp. NBRC 110053]|uniref:CPBP family intramembrane glutamic endopeptidase n=1 Tax=Demequina sp. NBRC 110053 TaxID=1570342 RepID=UPI0009FCE2D1|nr:CPBP family intramembrane glutamic endopeptidase [Demequina sp. NBRC 110053]